ncbi:hypothetical protein [Coleofasciculus sp.]|uniref:hypothetical protein n=1 Tax=Coleofasciculus sp. TaxID=3100458 RepID=UPI0039FACBEC
MKPKNKGLFKGVTAINAKPERISNPITPVRRLDLENLGGNAVKLKIVAFSVLLGLASLLGACQNVTTPPEEPALEEQNPAGETEVMPTEEETEVMPTEEETEAMPTEEETEAMPTEEEEEETEAVPSP